MRGLGCTGALLRAAYADGRVARSPLSHARRVADGMPLNHGA